MLAVNYLSNIFTELNQSPRPSYLSNKSVHRARNALSQFTCILGSEWTLVSCKANLNSHSLLIKWMRCRKEQSIITGLALRKQNLQVKKVYFRVQDNSAEIVKSAWTGKRGSPRHLPSSQTRILFLLDLVFPDVPTIQLLSGTGYIFGRFGSVHLSLNILKNQVFRLENMLKLINAIDSPLIQFLKFELYFNFLSAKSYNPLIPYLGIKISLLLIGRLKKLVFNK